MATLVDKSDGTEHLQSFRQLVMHKIHRHLKNRVLQRQTQEARHEAGQQLRPITDYNALPNSASILMASITQREIQS